MQTNIRRRSLRYLTATALVAVMISLTGCATMHGNAESESSFLPDWGDSFQLPPANGEKLGLSKEAREIESSLGFE